MKKRYEFKANKSNSLADLKDLMEISCEKCPTTGMSRFLERTIYKKIGIVDLQRMFPEMLKDIMDEAKKEYVEVTLYASTLTKIKCCQTRSWLNKIEPYKYLGKTFRYNEYLLIKREFQSKWLLYQPFIRQLLNQCVINLPYKLFTFDIGRLMKLNEFEFMFNEKVNEAKHRLHLFYKEITTLLNKQKTATLTSNYLATCSGLLSVHISRVLTHTLLHVGNFTNPKEVMPHLKLNITFNDGLILEPTADDVINAYKAFLQNIVYLIKELPQLSVNLCDNHQNNYNIFLCITDDFYNNCIQTITENINKLYRPVVEFTENLNNSFASKIYSHMQQNYVLEIISCNIEFEEGYKRIVYYEKYFNEIASIPDNTFFQIGDVCLQHYRDNLLNGIKKIKNSIFNKLAEQHYLETNDICETYQLIQTRANQIPDTTEELIETGKFMTDVKENRLDELNARAENSLQFLTSIILLGILSNKHIQINSLCYNWPEKITPTVEEYFSNYDQLKFDAEERLQKVVEDLSVTINSITPLLVILDNMDNIINSKNYLSHITLHMTKIQDIEKQIVCINNEEICLGFPKSTYPEFNDLKNHIYPFYHLLNLCVKIQRNLSVWLDGQFENLYHDKIVNLVESFTSELSTIQKSYRKKIRQAQDENLPLRFRGSVDDPDILNWPAPLKLCSKAIQLIDEFKPYIKIIEIMCNRALQPRHWNAMSQIAQQDITPNAGTTLRKIRKTDLKVDNLTQYEIISKSATKEKLLYDKLIELQSQWNQIKFSVGKYKGNVKILVHLENIEAIIDNQSMELIKMRGSVYVLPHEQLLKNFLKKIHKINEMIKNWTFIQEQWLKLGPIFECNYIIESIQNEYSLFQNVNKFCCNYIEKICQDSTVMDIMEKTDILNGVLKSIEELEQINKGISEYLEVVRNQFLRFYFLSNDEIVNILSECDELHKIQKYLWKLFTGIDSLVIEDNNVVVGMISKTYEKVMFTCRVDTKHFTERRIEKSLRFIENGMKSTVQDNILQCNKIYKNTNLTVLMRKYCQQIITVNAQIYWTETTENAINCSNKLQANLQQIENNLKEKSELINSNKLTSLEKFIIKNLFIVETNNKTVSKSLLENVNNDFLWAAQLKYYLENGVCTARLMQVNIKYSHEYLGNVDEIVITPLTDRCFRTLINTYYLRLNGLLKGPSQIGKSATIKNLAKALAVMFTQINCSHDLNHQTISRFLTGTIHCGTWLCLENINCIQPETLSVLTQDISLILTALNSASKECRLPFRNKIKLNPAFFICATLNSAALSLHPENIQKFFRTTTLSIPDKKIIIETILQSNGFTRAKLLTRKFITVFKLLRDLLPKQHQNSFNIKTIKSVLSECEKLKEIFLDENELLIAAKSIENLIIPQLTDDETDMFKIIIKDVFTGSLNCDRRDDNLESTIQNYCRKCNLDPKQPFVMKVIQTHELIKSKQGIILVGETFTGKSTTIKILSQYFPEIKYQVINNKCLTYNQLYGYTDLITQQWKDGILTNLCRQQQYNWLVFDGQFEPLSVDNINSMLEDDKVLYLASGERISLNHFRAIIIETDNLSTFTPSTVGILKLFNASEMKL